MPQCNAKSSRTGEPCKAQAIRGGSVCVSHGGAAPQVQAKAKERLAALVDPAITQLSKLLKDKQSNVRLGAVKDVLDRAGYKPTERLELEVGEELAGVLAAGRERIAGLHAEQANPNPTSA